MRGLGGTRLASIFPIGFAICLAGCGYVGEPLPPALKRPLRVTDLAAVERGSKIVIQFTIPKVTTEDLPIEGKPDIELRIGPYGPSGFQLQEWEHDSDRIAEIQLNNPVAHVEIPASKYYDKTVVAGVNVHGPHGRSAGWSNWVILPVIPALPTPQNLFAANAPDAVRLDWRAAAPEFRIFRKQQNDSNWMQIGTSGAPFYMDHEIEYGKTYQYFVLSIQKTDNTYAESEQSAPVMFRPEDKFAPAVPAGLTAVPAARSIELVWERNTEKDLASYRVYRNGQKVAEDVTAPAFSDRDVKPGTKYQYQVTAVDTANNESAMTAIVEAALP
jgi:hypothetical protein